MSESMDLLMLVLQWIGSGFIIFGAAFPYIPQYKKIKATGSAEGFSSYVCLTLLVAYILRIYFWFGRHFELPLLLQSFIMIAVMLLVMKACVETRRGPRHVLSDLNPRYFWQWTDFSSYLQFTVGLTVVVGLVSLLQLGSPAYVELLGFVSTLSEAMLGMPQLWKNLQRRSCRGMSLAMVLLWAAGDLYKTMYFVMRRVPYQFVLCGIIQLSTDAGILMQYMLYDRGPRLAPVHGQ